MGKSSVGMGQLGIKYSNYREMHRLQTKPAWGRADNSHVALALKMKTWQESVDTNRTLVASAGQNTDRCKTESYFVCVLMLLQFAPSLLQKFGSWPPISPFHPRQPTGPHLFSAGKLISRIDRSELGSFGHFACSFSLATLTTFPTFGALTAFATFATATFGALGALSLASFGRQTGLAFPHLARTGGLFLSCGSALVPDVRRLATTATSCCYLE